MGYLERLGIVGLLVEVDILDMLSFQERLGLVDVVGGIHDIQGFLDKLDFLDFGNDVVGFQTNVGLLLL